MFAVTELDAMIYLDYNATTPVDPLVLEAMRPFLEAKFGNPSSGHAAGREARRAVEGARASVAGLIGAKPSEVIFTSGGTEASNMAIKGTARRYAGQGKHFVTTTVEHPATTEPLRWLERDGFSFTAVGVDAHGMVAPDDVRRAIRPDTIMICVMHAQNEVGTLEPIAEIGRIAREAGVLFHVDAAQSVGKVSVNVDEMHADFLAIAGHKFYAPKGIGALYVRDGVGAEPLVHGAGQEGGRRGGTENVAMAVGMGRAAELAAKHLAHDEPGVMRDYFADRLREAIGDRFVVNGHPTRRLPSTLHVSFPGFVGGDLLGRLEGVCASTGAACHSGSAEPSAVLASMKMPRERAVGAIRFSVGRPTTREEIDGVVAMLAEAVEAAAVTRRL